MPIHSALFESLGIFRSRLVGGFTVVLFIGMGATVLLYKHSWPEGLQGPERTEFVQSYTKGCLGRYRRDMEMGVSREVIVNYCSCMANKEADLMSPRQGWRGLPSPGDRKTRFKSFLDEAFQICAETQPV